MGGAGVLVVADAAGVAVAGRDDEQRIRVRRERVGHRGGFADAAQRRVDDARAVIGRPRERGGDVGRPARAAAVKRAQRHDARARCRASDVARWLIDRQRGGGDAGDVRAVARRRRLVRVGSTGRGIIVAVDPIMAAGTGVGGKIGDREIHARVDHRDLLRRVADRRVPCAREVAINPAHAGLAENRLAAIEQPPLPADARSAARGQRDTHLHPPVRLRPQHALGAPQPARRPRRAARRHAHHLDALEPPDGVRHLRTGVPACRHAFGR